MYCTVCVNKKKFANKFTCSLSVLPQFSALYLVSLVVILIGFITFNAVPTPLDHTDPVTSSSSSICEGGWFDNPVATQDDITKQEVAVRINTEEEQDDGKEEQQRDGEKEEGWEERRKGKKKSASGPSQSLGQGNNEEDVAAVKRSTKM